MRLPVFEVAGRRPLKRLTLILRDGRVERVFYPVFPPDKNAEQVVGESLGGRTRPPREPVRAG